MILAIRTDAPEAELYLYSDSGSQVKKDIWLAGRSLARDLLRHIDDIREGDITGLIIFHGPGSFTGLRIGIVTANTIAYALQVPIVGSSDENWILDGVRKLSDGGDDKMVLPHYGADPHITAPRK